MSPAHFLSNNSSTTPLTGPGGKPSTRNDSITSLGPSGKPSRNNSINSLTSPSGNTRWR